MNEFIIQLVTGATPKKMTTSIPMGDAAMALLTFIGTSHFH